MASRLKPLFDRVLVERILPAAKSTGGILLPETAATKVKEGVVRRCGPGARGRDGSLIPLGVAEGDKVLLPEFGGVNVKLEGKEYTLYRDEELLGVLEDK
mmetsp:Transcript_19877/g.23857  ORF Transcript_19877/g.23857 Transcript_19877/m.23857 type:complete len:100 (-) Transcript_19877:276-575(-)|eukprot:CAMPEP_0197848664 /NCGR_PEP_ID=MMETSP1438-20131217/9527_1 /TAXON_ID=1461541 /ORGANISM="Pterosperma sp., Strain CCMP1384" /LENGTH=99 /DNA_ID=CAMNT_0043461021 /DNA_START=68 /DNA_END=367 /DNA_ORIENTATION=-